MFLVLPVPAQSNLAHEAPQQNIWLSPTTLWGQGTRSHDSFDVRGLLLLRALCWTNLTRYFNWATICTSGAIRKRNSIFPSQNIIYHQIRVQIFPKESSCNSKPKFNKAFPLETIFTNTFFQDLIKIQIKVVELTPPHQFLHSWFDRVEWESYVQSASFTFHGVSPLLSTVTFHTFW